MPQISCKYLGWKQPAIKSSADFLLELHSDHGLVDLTSVWVVTPTRRAGRRLREVLLQNAVERDLAIFPPQFTTVGQLPELLYEAKLPFATSLVQQFAWANALRQADRKTLRQIVPQHPADEADPRWMELGSLLQRQHLELTEHRLDFATVAEHGRQLEGFTDFDRWTALAKVQTEYLRSLDALKLWDRQTARNVAIEHNECQIDGQIVLVGTVDLSRTLRGMLEQVGDQVTSLVFAERSASHRFDEFGCVRPNEWQNAIVGVEDHQIFVADGPANQADAVVYAIEAFEGKYSASEITIGVPDVSLVPHLENKLQQFEIEVRWGPGRSLAASPPAQWLRIAADYLATQRYEPFAELIRHSDTHQYLVGLNYPRDIIKEFDRYFDDHMPDHVRPKKGESAGGNAGDLPEAGWLLFDLLKSLSGKSRSPKLWAEEIHDVVLRLYDRRQLNVDHAHDRATVDACDKINEAIARLAQLPDELAPDVSASAAILMILAQLADEEVPPAAGGDVIEMVGWLELPLDDAKVAIITNMNDGVVPRSVSSDVFLPNSFREALGLDDNARRYARDAYALQALLNSRLAVRLIVGRRAATNDPLRPSRLLMATQRDKLPDRCLRLFNGKADCAPIVMPVDHDELRFRVPRPTKLQEPITSLSVTAFGSYLICPYRFYLNRVRRLRQHDDMLTELDGSKFGSLAHDVLERFGKSEFHDSCDEAEISLYLAEQLRVLADEQFGKRPKPTVQVQLAQLRLRLEKFAERQVEWRERGWQIIRTEMHFDAGRIPVDGKDFGLIGRIDRIDRRVKDGEVEFAILDYKTGDRAESPKAKHIRGKRTGDPLLPAHWVDLQLPLYRYLVQSDEGLREELEGKTIKLGYVLLPSSSADTRFDLANWTEEDLITADQATEQIIRDIRDEIFWPPTDPFPYPNFDEHSAIVQHGVFGRAPFVEVEEMAG